MSGERLSLALERLGSGDWRDFEKFAAEFLAVEYPSLRTMASGAGDKGRDGELYQPSESPSVVFQYSVAVNWDAKIRQTAKRVAANFAGVSELIYATSQVIGPKADKLRREIREKHSIFLDIRDRPWFVEREAGYPQRVAASDRLAEAHVDPLLKKNRIKSKSSVILTSEEARIGFLHLSLSSQDSDSRKGLTKNCFECLVLGALHDTDPDNRLNADQVADRVKRLLPGTFAQQVDGRVRGALTRLSAKGDRIKRHRNTDDYCLSFEERRDLADRQAEFVRNETALEQEIAQAVTLASPQSFSTERLHETAKIIRVAMEEVLFHKGESFASSVRLDEPQQVDPEELMRTVMKSAGDSLSELTEQQLSSVFGKVMEDPSIDVQNHLRRLADGYTMFAFLRQTPDVQKVVLKLFAEGDIWLDTSVILPVMAETLIDDPRRRHYTSLLQAARDADLKLKVTPGVIEEAERHLNRALIFSKNLYDIWRGDVPFLYSAYALTGRSRSEFGEWAENFRGDTYPIEDVKEYLESEHQVEYADLREPASTLDADIRNAIEEYWSDVHAVRRNRFQSDYDAFATDRLIEHDVVNCSGVIALRQKVGVSSIGQHYWFLTLDRPAYAMSSALREKLGAKSPTSPVLSPDFLVELLRLGPLRANVERSVGLSLPVWSDLSRYDYVSNELIEVADKIRQETSSLSEPVIRRRVRDRLERTRMWQGREARGGIRTAELKTGNAILGNGD